MNVLCFSHLRWDFVFQRPQHLLTRFSKFYTVYFIEEPVLQSKNDDYSLEEKEDKLFVIQPLLNNDNHNNIAERQAKIIEKIVADNDLSENILWYYTPMALAFTRQLTRALTIYDCMDELSAFKNPPAGLQQLEKELFAKADIVFTGGYSLFRQKQGLHKNIYPFPSSIDKDHFSQARADIQEPADQQNIPHPRIGFFGVIDERFDVDLIKNVAAQKPEWQLILIGPVVKIDEAILPKNKNIHYLGSKNYKQLPAYLTGWDIAMVCFAINESTRFISPTKTPEYLAAGKPVISTPIADVVHPYGEENLVQIAKDAAQFIKAAEDEMQVKDKSAWLKKTDTFLADNSWENTVKAMKNIIDKELNKDYIKNKKGSECLTT